MAQPDIYPAKNTSLHLRQYQKSIGLLLIENVPKQLSCFLLFTIMGGHQAEIMQELVTYMPVPWPDIAQKSKSKILWK